MRAFSWSLRDIDETDIETLLIFVARFGQTGGKPQAEKPAAYCDQVDWL